MNLAYFELTDGLPGPKRAEIDRALAAPEDRQRTIDRQNAEAQKQLAALGMLPPPPPPRRKPKE